MGRKVLAKSLLATCTQRHTHTRVFWGSVGAENHVCAGSLLPWAESQKHLRGSSNMRDIIDVQGRKMSFACPIVACGECSIPSPHTSPRSRGRLAWVEDVVLACPPCSKQPGGQQPQKAAIRLPRFLWGYLTGFAYTEEQRKDVFFKKEKKKKVLWICG